MKTILSPIRWRLESAWNLRTSLAVMAIAMIPGLAVAQQLPPAGGGTIVIEAEDFSAVSGMTGPAAEFCAECSGQITMGSYSFGTWFEFEVETTQLLTYEISFRAASGTGTLIDVLEVDGSGAEKSLGNISIPQTGSFIDYADTAAVSISLAPGTHTLRFKNLQISANVDSVSFTAGSASDIRVVAPALNAGPDINPYKGWTSGWWRENEDHASVGFQYLEWGQFEPVDDEFDYEYVEGVLNRHGTNGRHIIVQFVCDWDGNAVLEDNYLGPDWLLDIVGERVGFRDPMDPASGMIRATNYDHPVFISEAIEAIHELQNYFRDDERTFVVQVGVLGLWAEWHTFPREDWDPLTATKQTILDAYFANIGDMQTQVRYPDEPVNTPRPQMGYTNGSVVPTTHGYEFGEGIEPGMLWNNGPVGGEWPPNVEQVYWENFFNTDEGFDYIDQARYSTILPPEVEEIAAMVPEFDESGRFMDMHRHLGYNFQVSQIRYLESANGSGPVHFEIDLHNVGIAPFYMDWNLQLAVIDASGAMVELIETDTDVRSIGSGQFATVTGSSCTQLDSAEQYHIGLRLLQPGADSTKAEPWKLNARNTYVVLANEIEVVEGTWGFDNALQGGWNLLAEIGVLLGDLNGDGAINLLDVQPFVTAVSNGTYVAAADMNNDNVVNLLDIGPFVEALSGN